MEGMSGERPLTTRQDHSVPLQPLPFIVHQTIETAPPLADHLFMWLFCQCESGGTLYNVSFLAPTSISLFKVAILVLTLQAHRQAWARPPTTAGNGQIHCVLTSSFPNSQAVVIKHYIYWRHLQTISTCPRHLKTHIPEIQLPGLHNAHCQK